MPPKTKAARSIFKRTPKQRAEAKMLGRAAAGKDPFKNGKPQKAKPKPQPTVKFTPTKKAVAVGVKKIQKARVKAATPKKAPAKRAGVGVVGKAVKKGIKTAVTAARKSVAKKRQSGLKPTAPKRRPHGHRGKR